MGIYGVNFAFVDIISQVDDQLTPGILVSLAQCHNLQACFVFHDIDMIPVIKTLISLYLAVFYSFDNKVKKVLGYPGITREVRS